MLMERSERGERQKEWNGREKRERRGEREKVHIRARKGEREEVGRAEREQENEGEYSCPWSGDREEYRGVVQR